MSFFGLKLNSREFPSHSEKTLSLIVALPGPWRASQVVLVVKSPSASAGDKGEADSIPGSGRAPGAGNGDPLQYPCLENPMDRGALQAGVHGATESRRRLGMWARRPMNSGPVPFLMPSVPGSRSSHPLLQQASRAPCPFRGPLPSLRVCLSGPSSLDIHKLMPFLLQVPAQVSPSLTSLIYGGFFCLWSLFPQGRTWAPWGQGSLLCSLIYPQWLKQRLAQSSHSMNSGHWIAPCQAPSQPYSTVILCQG